MPSASGNALGVLTDTVVFKSLGVDAGGLVGLYGKTPIAQRALAAQATSLVGTASSTAVDTDMKAAMIEIMNTLAAVGLWKGSA
jgi:hypothetical protein